MFRFTQASASLRPILSNLRQNTGIIVPQNFQNFQNLRYNSTIEDLSEKIGTFKNDSLLLPNQQVNYFREQLSLLNQYKRVSSDVEVFEVTFQNVIEIFKDEETRKNLIKVDLTKYLHFLNYSIFRNRRNRLDRRSNVDRDQYSNNQKLNDVKYRNALLDFHSLLINGELNEKITLESLEYYFMSMSQYNLNEEIVNYWETGVNDEQLSKLFLNSRILSLVLPIAYETKRFSYEEILRIFELNNDENKVDAKLLCSIGKICTIENDYERALDILESVLVIFENLKDTRVGLSLGDLHLNFISSSKDISIAKHFFDKVIENDLPYIVRLKVTHVIDLLNNCYESEAPFEDIVYFYETTLKFYVSKKIKSNAQFASLNNAFFKIFFQKYPQLNDESFSLLKKLMSDYNLILPVDELLLNTVISNYNWGDKKIFEQLIEYYDIFKITKTQVPNRIILKKMGEVDYSDEEILNQWNNNLSNLDHDRYTYIPIADWAAIRDATIFSKFDRNTLYWQIVKKYQNYFQDYRATVRFIRLWFKDREIFKHLKALNEFNDLPDLKFRNLKPTVDFTKIMNTTQLDEKWRK